MHILYIHILKTMNTTIDFILYYIIVVVFINAQKIDRDPDALCSVSIEKKDK